MKPLFKAAAIVAVTALGMGGLASCTAQALVPASKLAAPHTSYMITINKDANGSVHFTVTH